MSKRVRWIEHRGERILLNDYSDLREEQYLQELDETETIIKEAIKAQVPYLLVLTDVSNTTTTTKITEKAKVCTTLFKELEVVSAIVGVIGAKRVIANLLVPGIQICADREQAQDWLVAEAQRLGQRSTEGADKENSR